MKEVGACSSRQQNSDLTSPSISDMTEGSKEDAGHQNGRVSDDVWMTVGIGAAATIALVVVIILIVVCIRKCGKKKNTTSTDTEDGNSSAKSGLTGTSIQGIMQQHRVASVSRFGQSGPESQTPDQQVVKAGGLVAKVDSDTGSSYFRQLANLKGVKSVSEYQKK